MNLRKLRKDLHLTMKELGEIIDVSTQTISNWEYGIYEPNIYHLVKLANYFNVSIDYLVGRFDINDHLTMSKEELVKIIMKILESIYKE